MRCFVASVLCGLTLGSSGCKKEPPTSGKQANGEWVVRTAGNDPRLVAAAEEARRRWPEFVAAFNKREPNVAYAVKLPFPVRNTDKSEHMWIQVSSIDGDTIVGTLNNEPMDDVGLKNGDSYTTTVDKIEDWLIGRGKGKLTGAFSIRVLEEIEKEKAKKGP